MEKVSRGLPYKWIAIIVISIGSFMTTLDTSVIPISLPELGEVFHASPDIVLWVFLIYLLVGTGLMLTLGRAGDIIGRKRLYTAGFIIFTLGLGLCPLAQNITQLILFRLLESIGAAMLVAMAIAIVTASFPSSERGKALGILGAAAGVGLTSGPLLGGFLIDTLGWASIFYARLPIGVIGSVMAWTMLREQPSANPRGRFDLWGALTLFGFLTCLLLAVNQGQTQGWTSFFVLGLGTAAIVLLFLFLAVEKRTAEPVVDLGLFRDRLFATATWSHMLFYMAVAAVTFLMPFYLIQGIAYSPASAGLLLITIPVLRVIVAPLSGRLYDRLGSFLLCFAGLSLTCLGLFLLSKLNDTSTASDVVLRLAITGLGIGLFVTPNTSAIMGTVGRPRLGTAAAMIPTVRQIGTSIGLAIAGTVFVIAGFRDALLVALVIGALALLMSLLRREGARRRKGVWPMEDEISISQEQNILDDSGDD
jgi:EmrB/QacA subfamily drug resistance transporter